ncbi:MAG: hypothetical protein ACLFWL_04705 [Candidatus Brocadiia bacterium]
MGTEKVVCPSCGQEVDPEEGVCPNCGVNVRSGETFKTRMKRARGRKTEHTEIMRNLGFAIVLAFGLIILAGFMYHRRVLKVMSKRQNRRMFSYYTRKMDWLRGLVKAGKVAQARREGKALVKELQQDADAIEIELAPSTEQKEQEREPKSHREAKKALLKNMSEKVEHLLSNLPETGNNSAGSR